MTELTQEKPEIYEKTRDFIIKLLYSPNKPNNSLILQEIVLLSWFSLKKPVFLAKYL